MRFKDYKEAKAFVVALSNTKANGTRGLLGVKMDSVPAWEAAGPGGKLIEHKLDGSEVEAVYLSYLGATDKQKEQALPAKLAGVKLERISGRLVDVRTCKDGTVQLLLTNGLRDGQGKVAFRGPNIDKGILCALSFNEGLGESVEDIIARVPAEAVAQLKENKNKLAPKKKKKKKNEPESVPVPVPAPEPVQEADVPVMEPIKARRGPAIIDVPSLKPESGETRLKLK